MKHKILTTILTTILILSLTMPLSTQAKTIKIQSHIYQKELNTKFKNKQLRLIVNQTIKGKIGYVGKFENVKSITTKINSKCGTHLVTWNVISRNKSANYYKQFITSPNKSVTNDEIMYTRYQPYWIYYVTLCPKYGNKVQQRKHYWTLAKKSLRKAKVHSGDSDRITVKKISYWICKHTKYKSCHYDNAEMGTLFSRGKGVCRDYSDAFWAMCKLSGIPCKYYTGKVTGGGYHGWNKVKIKGKWYWIDLTWMDNGKTINKKYYLKRKLWNNHKVTQIGKKSILSSHTTYLPIKH